MAVAEAGPVVEGVHMTGSENVTRGQPLPWLVRRRALLICGVIGPPLFVVTFLVAGVTRPGYSPMRHPVSSLALGDSGWVQTVNFIVTGILLLAYALALWPSSRRYGTWIVRPLLIGMVAIGLVGAGIFTTDPVSGYPPGTSVELEYTTEGALHDAFSIPVFLALPLACWVAGYRFAIAGRTWWGLYSVATGVVVLVGFLLASIGFSQDATLTPIAGLVQRLTLIVGFTWITVRSIHLLSSPPPIDPASGRGG